MSLKEQLLKYQSQNRRNLKSDAVSTKNIPVTKTYNEEAIEGICSRISQRNRRKDVHDRYVKPIYRGK